MIIRILGFGGIGLQVPGLQMAIFAYLTNIWKTFFDLFFTKTNEKNIISCNLPEILVRKGKNG